MKFGDYSGTVLAEIVIIFIFLVLTSQRGKAVWAVLMGTAKVITPSSTTAGNNLIHPVKGASGNPYIPLYIPGVTGK